LCCAFIVHDAADIYARHNSSPFALDLVGAVIRQGTFVDKMQHIDWLHSPALQSTMARLLVRYDRFFTILEKYPSNTAVPTLDIDLAWHTHQLSPQSYWLHSVSVTGRLVDHDDKIMEEKLSDGFALTSKAYQKLYKEPYSECTCWYCCAIRESHSSAIDKLFRPSVRSAGERLHSADDGDASDPLKSPHISAHNVVKDTSADGLARAAVHTAKLDKEYHKACARAKKKGYKEPRRDEYFYAYAWGYPIPYPIYYPYTVDPGVSGGDFAYAANPAAIDCSEGAYGACVAKTCGGTSSAGGCGGGCSGGDGGDGGGCGGCGGCGG
jgi:hypothetical protein